MILHQQVDMILFAIELDQFRFKIFADAGEDASQVVEHLFGKDTSPVFCVTKTKCVRLKIGRLLPCNGFKLSDTN